MGRFSAAKRMDMLTGSLWDKILIFALPLALSSILQQLFNSVDMAVVGHFAAEPAKATAAVGCNGPVINLIVNLFIGISVGANVVIANHLGSGEKKEAGKAVHSAMLIAVLSGICLMFAGLAVSSPILRLMNTPEDIMPYAVLYLRRYSLGLPFIMIYNFGSAVLRSIGDTKRPLVCLVSTGIMNAVLNLIFVIFFHLDVAGVAAATVIANAVSAALVLFFLMQEKSEIHLSLKLLRIRKEDLVPILKIGVPAGIQSMLFSISNVIIQSILNSYGTTAVAGSAVALNYESFLNFVTTSFNQAAVTFTSQNFGAGKYDRCRKVFRLCMIYSMAITAVMSIVFLSASRFFASIFTSDEAVLEYALIRMWIVLSLKFIAATYEVGGAAMQGIGHSLTPALLTVFGTCIFRLVWAYTVCRAHPGFVTLLSVYPVSWVLTGAAVLIAYFTVRKKVFSSSPAC